MAPFKPDDDGDCVAAMPPARRWEEWGPQAQEDYLREKIGPLYEVLDAIQRKEGTDEDRG